MDPDEVRWRLLVSAAEGYEPMFHALWEFGVPDDPRPGAPPADEIKAVLRGMIEQGLIELFQGVDDKDDFVPVPACHRRDVFDDPHSWQIPEDPKTDVRYSTTSAGDAAVARQPDGLAEINWDTD
jgi:hypothetical protein